MTSQVADRIRSFIVENLLFKTSAQDLTEDMSLIDAGIIDSTAVLELVSFLESDLGIVVDDAEIVPENLDSIRSIARYVTGKLGTAAAA